MRGPRPLLNRRKNPGGPMRLRKVLLACAAAGVAVAATAVFLTRDAWKRRLFPAPTAPAGAGEKAGGAKETVEVSPQAQATLRLDVRPLKLTTAWRSLELPGQVIELPGRSDLIVTSPVAGVVRRVLHSPWQTVRPGETLFSLGLVSEFLQNSQTALFKAQRDLELLQKQGTNVAAAEREGGLPGARLLEVERQERSLLAAIQGHRFELAARGLRPAEIDRAAKGQFISDIDIPTPEQPGAAGFLEVQ